VRIAEADLRVLAADVDDARGTPVGIEKLEEAKCGEVRCGLPLHGDYDSFSGLECIVRVVRGFLFGGKQGKGFWVV